MSDSWRYQDPSVPRARVESAMREIDHALATVPPIRARIALVRARNLLESAARDLVAECVEAAP